MKPSVTYIPSHSLLGPTELLRQHSFTRWMTRDLTQAATDFNRNIGLFPLYCECSPEHLTRQIFWRLPQGAMIEVRSGRSKDRFEEFDQVNCERNWKLLSLHINENEHYSGVWVSAEHAVVARAVLAAHGVTPAERIET
jgi:hypothetical protein